MCAAFFSNGPIKIGSAQTLSFVFDSPQHENTFYTHMESLLDDECDYESDEPSSNPEEEMDIDKELNELGVELDRPQSESTHVEQSVFVKVELVPFPPPFRCKRIVLKRKLFFFCILLVRSHPLLLASKRITSRLLHQPRHRWSPSRITQRRQQHHPRTLDPSSKGLQR
jgi:hypothetical protein